MTWKTFLVAWVTGSAGVTLGRWLWARRARRKSSPKHGAEGRNR